MTLLKVTLAATYVDGQGSPLAGSVKLAPNAPLTDAADSDLIRQVPISATLDVTGSFSVQLFATDNGSISPSGWSWVITESITGTPPRAFSFALAHANGATQNLASLAPVPDSVPAAAYLPIPSGAATAGEVPVATGTGNATAWTSVATSSGEQAARRTVGQNVLQPVATRNNSYYLGLFGSSSTQTFRSKHKATCDITSLVLEYGNSYGTSAGAQGDGPGALTVSCSVEPSSGVLFRGFFGASHTGTVNPGAVLRSDMIGCFIPKGTYFFVRTYVSGNWPIGLTLNAVRGLNQDTTGDPTATSDSGEGVASPSGNDVTAAGSVTSSYVNGYTPFSILGTTRTAQPVFVLVGDSIANYSDEMPDMGWVVRALNNAYPLVKLSQPGETAQQWAVNGTSVPLVEARRRLFRYGTHFVFADGRNDCTASRTLSQIQADMITGWNMALAQAGVSWQSTITPRTTSTDQWATLTNQTADASETVRVNLNGWLRDGAPMLSGAAVATGSSAPGTVRAGGAGHPLAGVLEVANVVESAQNSGKWNIAQLRTVSDGAMTSSTKTLTSATASFTSADVGKSVFVAGAGSAGAVLTGTITAVTNSTTVTVATTAATTVSAAAVQIGASTYDGTHPDGFFHRAIASALASTFTAASAAYLASGV